MSNWRTPLKPVINPIEMHTDELWAETRRNPKANANNANYIAECDWTALQIIFDSVDPITNKRRKGGGSY